VAYSKVNVPALIRRALSEQPDASVDDIVRQLSVWGVQAPGIIVAMWMLRWKEYAVAIPSANGRETNHHDSQSLEGDLYCNCDQAACSCGASRPMWWHQYCCGVRISATQARMRDEYFITQQRKLQDCSLTPGVTFDQGISVWDQ
jgi:hypothetical protein